MLTKLLLYEEITKEKRLFRLGEEAEYLLWGKEKNIPTQHGDNACVGIDVK